MTNDYTEQIQRLEKYEAASVASQYAQEGDLQRADMALSLVPLDDDGKVLMGSEYFSTPQGISEASQLFGNEFNRSLYGLTLAGAREFYNGELSSLSDEARSKADELFTKYAKKTIGDIEKAYMTAQQRLKNPEAYRTELADGGLKGEELDKAFEKGVKKAQKDKENYEVLIQVRGMFQKGREDPIRKKVRASALEKILVE